MSKQTINDGPKKTTKPRGRPLEFNQDEALEKALKVFWERGYEGASMSELVDELGINKPSIYAAFGNKEALFLKVLDKYITSRVAFIGEALNEPTAKLVAKRFLLGAADFFSDKSHPSGCMVVQGALSCGQDAKSIQDYLIFQRLKLEQRFQSRFELAKAQGDLPSNINSSDLAKYLTTLHQGMSVQATSGAGKTELLSMVQLVLDNWPSAH